MFELVLQTQIDEAVAALDTVRRDQLPFAISLAVNRSAIAGQQAERAHILQAFTVRRNPGTPQRPGAVLRTVKIEKYDFANKRNPTAFRISIDATRTKSGGRRDYLAKFEEGGEKTAADDMVAPIAIPSKALRPNFRDLVAAKFYPQNLRLTPKRVGGGEILPARQKVTARGVVQWKGKLRTFVLDPRFHGEARGGEGEPTWGVYQRTGPGKRDIQLLWTYKHGIPIPRRLEFKATIADAVTSSFVLNFSNAYARAIATARPQ
jgi:hypothetical protein